LRIAQVIGRVTLNIQDPSYKGGRWLLANPLDATQFTLVTYDDLGAGEGDIVGVVEGAEATAPFDFPIPIDAITVAIFDTLTYVPPVNRTAGR